MTPIIDQINKLKKEKNAIILAHNYVDGAIQDIADFVGDSLELSIKARDAKADIILFAGVQFMGETAKLLSPKTKVLLPRVDAGCPMADMALAEDVEKYMKSHPNTVAVAYVNSTAATKAQVDICCTSSNAEAVVKSIPADKEIIFLPDQNLGRNISKKLGRPMKYWEGNCPIHHEVTPKMIEDARVRHPGVEVLIHPECPVATVDAADYALSTGGMLKYVSESPNKAFIIATETGIIYRMKKENPTKTFYALAETMTCPDMKKLTIEDVLKCLETESGEVILDPSIIERARLPIDRMLEIK